MAAGDNGVYLVYRLHPDPEGGQHDRRLVGRIVLAAGQVTVLEDHDGVVEDMFPNGKMTGQTLRRLQQMEHSPYWKVVREDEVHGGQHEDLIEEMNLGTPWPVQE